jgi:hypothetical protein
MNVFKSSCKSLFFFLKIFTRSGMCREILIKVTNTKFGRNRIQRDAELFHADRRSDVTQLMVIFGKLLSDRTLNRFVVWCGLLE